MLRESASSQAFRLNKTRPKVRGSCGLGEQLDGVPTASQWPRWNQVQTPRTLLVAISAGQLSKPLCTDYEAMIFMLVAETQNLVCKIYENYGLVNNMIQFYLLAIWSLLYIQDYRYRSLIT